MLASSAQARRKGHRLGESDIQVPGRTVIDKFSSFGYVTSVFWSSIFPSVKKKVSKKIFFYIWIFLGKGSMAAIIF